MQVETVTIMLQHVFKSSTMWIGIFAKTWILLRSDTKKIRTSRYRISSSQRLYGSENRKEPLFLFVQLSIYLNGSRRCIMQYQYYIVRFLTTIIIIITVPTTYIFSYYLRETNVQLRSKDFIRLKNKKVIWIIN